MLKIVHAADIHAGRPAPRELDRDKASVRRGEIEAGLTRIVDLVRQEKADLLLLSGDLFEQSHARATWAREAAELFRSVGSTKVFISPGNHDPLVRDSLYKTVTWPDNVVVFDNPEVAEVVLKDLGAVVYGLGWRTYLEHRRILRGFHSGREGFFNILMAHGDFLRNSVSEDGGSQYLPIHVEDLAGSGMDYAALGHIHVPGEFRAGTVRAVYPGCFEPLDFGDRGERGVYLVTVGARSGSSGPTARSSAGSVKYRVSAQFIPMAARQMRRDDLDITGLDTVERVRNAILAAGEETIRKRDLWALTLTGVVEPDMILDLPTLEREMEEDFFFLRLIPDYAPGYDFAALADPNNKSLEARFTRHLISLRDDLTKRGETRPAAVADLALYYGLDALRQGKVTLRRGR